MSQRASCWSLTINNPTADDEECIALARQKGWKIEGQKEEGKEGTPHYQLIAKTPQVRFSAVKKMFPRAHIEVARNPAALENYVKKDETRVGALNVASEMYPSLTKVYDMWIDMSVGELDETQVKAQWLYKYEHEGLKQRWHQYSETYLLASFDKAISAMIRKGFYVESMAVNPQVRSAVKNYGWSIVQRSQNNISVSEHNKDASAQEEDDSSVSSASSDSS